ncbi:MAG: gamma-glutamyltransferase family protein [Silicimonas sp.]|nr:gamma-glutamyltransferase family protein [Silicimonas sp.]
MQNTARATRGMVTAPHHLASEAGLRVLREGGNAIEAAVAIAATLTVVYPHMNALGGDNFWLLHGPGGRVSAIDACGAAAGLADGDFFRNQGLDAIPSRGPLAALTMAGAASGMARALEEAARWGGRLPLSRLFEDAIFHAESGTPAAETLAGNAAAKAGELRDVPGFAGVYLTEGQPPKTGEIVKQPRLAHSFRRLAEDGLDSFYRGEMARSMAADLERVGSPIRAADFARHRSLDVTPLTLNLRGHTLYNMPPPTQGLAALIILGIYDRLGITAPETTGFVHGIVEATKQAFRIRDAHVCDPAYMRDPAETWLAPARLDAMAAAIDPDRAAPWPHPSQQGDTVWFGAVDGAGRAVSAIQSIYWEFGSGVVLEESGLTWQNRGTSFSLAPGHHNALMPHHRPFHTIQPALAHLADGRVMPWGTMGGEGQPQTQAMIFARHVLHGMDLQKAVSAPRWLLGRTWGAETTTLKLENRIEPGVLDGLRRAGHAVEVLGGHEEMMGHAGALVWHPGGLIEGASDPRSDGAAIGF